MACTLWQQEQVNKEEASKNDFKYKVKSAEAICGEINRSKRAVNADITIVARSVRSYVKQGWVGQPLQQPGEKGRITKEFYQALCSAIKSYVILCQQEGTKSTITRPILISKVNACVNKKEEAEGMPRRKNRKLFSRIQVDLAEEVDIGRPNRIEQHRNKWSTYANLDLWFTSLKCFLVEKGFAMETPSESVDVDGEVQWVSEDQGRRIANLDESGIGLDNTELGQGGRPPVGFFQARISSYPTYGAHKSSKVRNRFHGRVTVESVFIKVSRFSLK
jgi:hypothetical protein